MSGEDSGKSRVAEPKAGLDYLDGTNLYGPYFIPNRLDPSGYMTQEECDAFLSNAMNDEQVMVLILDLIGMDCPFQEPKCDCDCPSEGESHLVTGVIKIGCKHDQQSITETLRHELLHLKDRCGQPIRNCNECIITEVNSYSNSGQCDEGGSTRIRIGAATKRECVALGAMSSCAGSAHCKDKSLEDLEVLAGQMYDGMKGR